MRDKLQNAIRNTPSSKLVYQKTAPTLREVLKDLQVSVATALESVEFKELIATYVHWRRHDVNRNI